MYQGTTVEKKEIEKQTETTMVLSMKIHSFIDVFMAAITSFVYVPVTQHYAEGIQQVPQEDYHRYHGNVPYGDQE
jgi:hypothetical protein